MKSIILIIGLAMVCQEVVPGGLVKNYIKRCENDLTVCHLSMVYGGDSISCYPKNQEAKP